MMAENQTSALQYVCIFHCREAEPHGRRMLKLFQMVTISCTDEIVGVIG